MLSVPLDVTPERLFRLLLQKPRPTQPIAFRFADATDTPLHVVALTGLEWELACDGVVDTLDEIRDSGVASAIISASLHSRGGRVFHSPQQVRELLEEGQLAALWSHVVYALSVCCPIQSRCDLTWWQATLLRGAEHPTNTFEALAMVGCCDVSFSARIPRPDRYFGLPISELTDGQRMAYDAAFKFVDGLVKHRTPSRGA